MSRETLQAATYNLHLRPPLVQLNSLLSNEEFQGQDALFTWRELVANYASTVDDRIVLQIEESYLLRPAAIAVVQGRHIPATTRNPPLIPSYPHPARHSASAAVITTAAWPDAPQTNCASVIRR